MKPNARLAKSANPVVVAESGRERLVEAICRIDGCTREDAGAQIDKFEQEFRNI